jgi:hypothetical protein
MKSADLLSIVQQKRGDWPASLVMAFAEKESGRHDGRGQLIDFDERAFLPDRNGGSYGIFQLDVPTARDRGFKGVPGDLFDAPTNTTFAIAQLDWLADYLRRHGSFGLQSLIAAYNEGGAAVVRGNPDPRYVGVVMAYRQKWGLALGEGVT